MKKVKELYKVAFEIQTLVNESENGFLDYGVIFDAVKEDIKNPGTKVREALHLLEGSITVCERVISDELYFGSKVNKKALAKRVAADKKYFDVIGA